MQIDFPFHFDSRGRTAATDADDHIRDMIEQFLFTNVGERVNRPDFGSGVLQLVFAPNSPELAATLQLTIQAALQQWIGDLIEVKTLAVTSEDASLRIEIQYLVRRTQVLHTTSFNRSMTP
ncbi:MAG: GPW/gp25 family protein [Desulfobacteraceae bacterium]|nr:GPW/gp25 family protein [Desulfobacteraceae bacterium]